MASAFRFIDLFAGIGGLRIGFEAIGGECVFTSEWNKFSVETYRANFPNDHHPIAGDITQVPVASIPEHDVVLAGFPCQPFSIAGVSKKNSLGRLHGFADETQGTLFFNVLEVLDYHKPKAFLLENVKNLRSHDKGRTFRVIMDSLDALGYDVDAEIFDARHWVPQHRERIFIAGFRRDQRAGFKLSETVKVPSGRAPILGDILEANVPSKYTLTDHLWQYLRDYADKHRAAGNGFGFGLCKPDQTTRTLSARYYKDGSEILVEQPGRNPRRLTPRECAYLMGFDVPHSNDPWKIPVSDTQAYKQFGNAVAPPVAKAVAAAMQPFIEQAMRDAQEARALVA